MAKLKSYPEFSFVVEKLLSNGDSELFHKRVDCTGENGQVQKVVSRSQRWEFFRRAHEGVFVSRLSARKLSKHFY